MAKWAPGSEPLCSPSLVSPSDMYRCMESDSARSAGSIVLRLVLSSTMFYNMTACVYVGMSAVSCPDIRRMDCTRLSTHYCSKSAEDILFSSRSYVNF